MFDKRAFPYIFDCGRCEDELWVTYSDAVDLAAHCAPDAGAAVDVVRKIRGWFAPPEESGLVCPSCAAKE
jgi:hypothetical protein